MNNYQRNLYAQQGRLNYARVGPPVAIPPPIHPVVNIPVDEDEEEGAPGPLLIRIQAPVYINGNNNICATDTAELTQRVSQSLARAIRQLAGAEGNGGAGIPMIDGNGAPRKIEVLVDVGTRIQGHGNLVGEGAVVERLGGSVRNAAGVVLEEQVVVNGVPLEQQAGGVNVKAEPVDEVVIVDGPIDQAVAPTVHNGASSNVEGNSPNPTINGMESPVMNDGSAPVKATPRAGTKRKNARIAHEDEVAPDAGLGITASAHSEPSDHAAKRSRRG